MIWVHQMTHELIGSNKANEIMKMGKIWSGPTKDMSAQKPVSWLGLFSISYSKLALDLHIRFRNSSLNLIKIKTEMWVNQFLRSSK